MKLLSPDSVTGDLVQTKLVKLPKCLSLASFYNSCSKLNHALLVLQFPMLYNYFISAALALSPKLARLLGELKVIPLHLPMLDDGVSKLITDVV